MRHLLAIILMLTGLPVAAAEGTPGPAPVLAELYVSQNCANCPAAMQEIAAQDDAREGVFVLTWSVDYWNYLGWHDTLAQPAFTRRQKRYARALDLRGPYTPMLVVNGSAQTAGNRPAAVGALLDAALGAPPSPGLTVSATITPLDAPGQFRIVPSARGVAALDVTLAAYAPGDTIVTPQRGPNRRVTLSHRNAVLGLMSLGRWEAAGGPASFDAACPGHCALILSAPETGDVLFVVPDIAG